jgi:hypothetical protein
MQLNGVTLGRPPSHTHPHREKEWVPVSLLLGKPASPLGNCKQRLEIFEFVPKLRKVRHVDVNVITQVVCDVLKSSNRHALWHEKRTVNRRSCSPAFWNIACMAVSRLKHRPVDSITRCIGVHMQTVNVA